MYLLTSDLLPLSQRCNPIVARCWVQVAGAHVAGRIPEALLGGKGGGCRTLSLVVYVPLRQHLKMVTALRFMVLPGVWHRSVRTWQAWTWRPKKCAEMLKAPELALQSQLLDSAVCAGHAARKPK